MLWLVALPFTLQGILILIDEFGFHMRRTLPRWERIGHPLDTLSLLLCLGWISLMPVSTANAVIYLFLSAFSMALITKDEWVHHKHCSAGELWIHALLFILHPLALFAAALAWPWLHASPPEWVPPAFGKDPDFLQALMGTQISFVTSFLLYQVLFWNFFHSTTREPRRVNNELYHSLNDAWYEAQAHPVALLRAESRLRNPWILERIRKRFGERACRILDVGCGAGFLSNAAARAGHSVAGIDLSESSLEIARMHDSTGRVEYRVADAREPPFEDESFDVACAMDFLEHVEEPARVVAAVARLLKPGGLFFFHTFDRNPLSWLIVIKGMEWFVRNTPEKLHVYHLFIRPRELRASCARAGLEVLEMTGVRPRFLTRAFWRMLLTGKISGDFSFTFTRSLKIGYSGIAQKKA